MPNKSQEASFNFSNSFTDWVLEQPPSIWYTLLVFHDWWWTNFLLTQMSTLQSPKHHSRNSTNQTTFRKKQVAEPSFPQRITWIKPRHSKASPANPDPHLHCGIRGTSLSGSSETSRKIGRTAFHCNILTSTCSLGMRDHTLHSRFVNQTGKVAHETRHALDNLSHEAIHMYKFLMFYLCNHHPAQNQRKLALFAKLLVN